MSDYHDPLRRDSPHRDPIYDVVGDPGQKQSMDDYGSGPLWGLIIGFLLVAGILLAVYSGNPTRTAQTQPTPAPASRIVTPPAPSPAPAVQPAQPTNPTPPAQ